MRTCTTVIFVCLIAAIRVDAREPYEHESVCLAYMGQVESKLASHLPDGCKIVDTHPSPLGRRFARIRFIRDAWISRSGTVAVKVFLFAKPLPDDPLPSDATVTKLTLETRRSDEKLSLGIAVLGEDKELVRHVVEILNEDVRPKNGVEIEKRIEPN